MSEAKRAWTLIQLLILPSPSRRTCRKQGCTVYVHVPFRICVCVVSVYYHHHTLAS